MKSELSLLGQFREREEEIRHETAALDKEMEKKRAGYEKAQAVALAKLETARAALARMKADYLALKFELEARAAAEIQARSVTAEKVEKGEASIKEFMASGISGDAIEAQARIEAGAKLAEAMKIIRAKAAEIFQLEYDEAESRFNVIYCATYPGQNQIVRLKSEIQALEQGVSAVLAGYPQAGADRERGKINIELCSGKSLSGVAFDRLTFEELKDLRFDPRFSAKQSEQLESCIAQMAPGQVCQLMLVPGGYGKTEGLQFRIMDDAEQRRRGKK